MESIIKKAVETLRGACRRGRIQTEEELGAVFTIAAHTLQQDKTIIALEKRIAELERSR